MPIEITRGILLKCRFRFHRYWGGSKFCISNKLPVIMCSSLVYTLRSKGLC